MNGTGEQGHGSVRQVAAFGYCGVAEFEGRFGRWRIAATVLVVAGVLLLNVG
jgi:hypothetical protein